MHTNGGIVTDEQNRSIDMLLSITGLLLTFTTVTNKAKKFVMLGFTMSPIYVFAQGLLSGYESTMTQLVLEETGLDLEQQSEVERPSLQSIQENIRQYFFTHDGLKRNFLVPFEMSLSMQLQKIQAFEEQHLAKEDALVRGLLTGEDYWRASSFGNVKSFGALVNPTKSLKTLEKPFRAMDTMLRRTYSIEKHAAVVEIDGFIRMLAGGLPSSLVSTLFINLDTLGRAIGGSLAVLSKENLGLSFSNKLTKYAVPALLSTTFLLKEVADFMFEFSVGTIHKGFFYPLCTGVAVGMHEAIVKEHPDLARRFQGDRPLIPPEVTSDNRSMMQIIKSCYDRARKYYGRYDKSFELEGRERDSEVVMQENLARKVGSSKKILEGRRAFFSICKKNKYTGYAKEVLLIARASILIFQMAVAKIIFSVAKNVAGPIYKIGKNELLPAVSRSMSRIASAMSAVVSPSVKADNKGVGEVKEFDSEENRSRERTPAPTFKTDPVEKT